MGGKNIINIVIEVRTFFNIPNIINNWIKNSIAGIVENKRNNKRIIFTKPDEIWMSHNLRHKLNCIFEASHVHVICPNHDLSLLFFCTPIQLALEQCDILPLSCFSHKW